MSGTSRQARLWAPSENGRCPGHVLPEGLCLQVIVWSPPHAPSRADGSIIPILQARNRSLREGRGRARGSTAKRRGSGDSSPGPCTHSPCPSLPLRALPAFSPPLASCKGKGGGLLGTTQLMRSRPGGCLAHSQCCGAPTPSAGPLVPQARGGWVLPSLGHLQLSRTGPDGPHPFPACHPLCVEIMLTRRTRGRRCLASRHICRLLSILAELKGGKNP